MSRWIHFTLLLCLLFVCPAWSATSREEGDAALKEGKQQEQLQTPAGYQDAIRSFLKAADAYQRAGMKKEQAGSLVGTGFCYYNIRQPQKAVEYYQKALTLEQELGDRGSEAVTLSNIGAIYKDSGQPQMALEFFNRSLPLHREVGDKKGEAITLNNLGAVYKETGQLQKGLEYLDKALPLRQQVGDKKGEATTLIGIGGIYADAGQPQGALEYYQKALPLEEAVGNKSGEAITLNNIGAVYRETSQPQKALEYLEKALRLKQEVGDRRGEATALNNIGEVYKETGQVQKGLEYLEKALPLLQEVGDRRAEAGALSNSALALDSLGRKQEARTRYEEALKQVDAIVGSITRDELKRSAADFYQPVYTSYIDFLLRQHNTADTGHALQVSEMARSRALRDLLAGNASQLPAASLASTVKPQAGRRGSLTAEIAQPVHAPTLPAIPGGLFRALASSSRAMQGVALKVEDLPPMQTAAQAQKFQRQEVVLASTDGPVVLYHILDEDVAIFVVGTSGDIHVARSPVKPAALLSLIQQARTAITANDDPSETRSSLRKLYSLLIQPVQRWIGKNEGGRTNDLTGRNPESTGQWVNRPSLHPHTSAPTHSYKEVTDTNVRSYTGVGVQSVPATSLWRTSLPQFSQICFKSLHPVSFCTSYW